MLLNLKAWGATVPDSVINLDYRKENGGWAGKLHLESRGSAGSLLDLPCPITAVNGKLGNPTNLRPRRTWNKGT